MNCFFGNPEKTMPVIVAAPKKASLITAIVINLTIANVF